MQPSSMKPAGGRNAPEAGDSFPIRSRVIIASALAGVLIVGCGGWAAQARIAGAVIAQGKVAVKKQVKLVQHRDGGIVAEILVANGGYVRAGDVLLRLDETQTKAELGVIRAQLAEHLGRRARLTAERDGEETVVFEPDFEDTPLGKSIAAGELRLFTANHAMREGQREQLVLQVEQLEEQVHGLTAQHTSNVSERAMIAEDLERLRPLVERQLMETSRIRTLERDLARIDGSRGEIEANIARIGGQIAEAKLKTIELDQSVRTDTQKELREGDARIAELQERIVAAQDRLSRMDLRSPITGFVNELNAHTVGGVIAPGSTVMSIVPEGEELTVEARLAPADIDQVQVGQPAKLRFSAFNQRTTPEVTGEVAMVAAAATLDPASGQHYYLGDIAITDDMRAALGEKHLMPGMPVEVFLSTAERSAISYLVKPFTDQMMKAFREE